SHVLHSFPTRRSSDLTLKNGYGSSKQNETYFEKFYGEKFPTYQEASQDKSGKYILFGNNAYFNNSIYKKRMKFVIKPFLQDANRSEEHTSELQSRENL